VGLATRAVGQVKTPPFSAEARVETGVLLRRLQRGERLTLPHSRPMPSVGPRCHELRIVDADATWRVIYRLDADAIVAEVFSKKTRATPKQVIRACQRRLRAYDAWSTARRTDAQDQATQARSGRLASWLDR
jgi:phage-related protein